MFNMYVFFDFETTGTNPYQARAVQLAWIWDDEQGNVSQKCYKIKPVGFTIPAEAVKIHGITTEDAAKNGNDLRSVLTEFNNMLKVTDILVAHNMPFDFQIFEGECKRAGIVPEKIPHTICTQKSKSITDFCQLPNPNYPGKYKWPKLSELYYKLFEKKMLNEHDALADSQHCLECFFELKRRGII